MSKRYMDFVPKQGVKKPVDPERAAMLEVAPERRNAPGVNFEASVASAVTEVQPEGDVQIRMTTKRRVTEVQRPVRRVRRATRPVTAQPKVMRRVRTTPTTVETQIEQPVQTEQIEQMTQATSIEQSPPASQVERPVQQRRIRRPVQQRRMVRRTRVQPNPAVAQPTRPVTEVPKTTATTATTAVARRNSQLVDDIPLDADLLNDPLERPISEFADLEQLAQEIEEVTRGGAVIEEEAGVVSTGTFSLQQEPKFGVVEDYQPRFIEAEVNKRPLSGAYGNAMEAELTEVRNQASEENLARAKQAKVKAPAFGKSMRRVAKTGMAVGVAGAAAAGVTGVAKATAAQKTARVATRTARKATGAAPRVARKAANMTANMPSGATRVAVNANTVGTGVRAGVTAGMASGAVSGANAAAQQAKMKIPQAHFINQNKVTKRPLSKNAYAPRTEAAKAPAADDGAVKVVKGEKKGGTFGMIVAIIVTIVLGAAAGTVAFLLLPR